MKKINSLVLPSFALCILFLNNSNIGFGQQSASFLPPLPIHFDSTYLKEGTYVFDDTFKIMKEELFTIYKNQFGLGNNDEMHLVQTMNIDNTSPIRTGENRYYSKYIQFHKGYEVEGTQMNVLGQLGVVLRSSGFIMKELDVDVHSPISESQALTNALNEINANIYYWEDPETEATLKETLDDSTATFYPKAKLVIRRVDGGTTVNDYKLCYVFLIYTLDPIQINTVVVDAKSGEILERPVSTVGYQYETGDVDTWYNGIQNIETRTCFLCSNYSLIGGPERRIYGHYFKWSDNYGQDVTKVVKDDNNHWTAQEDNRSMASAYWIANQAWDYYIQKHGRWGSDYLGKNIFIVGNYTNISSNAAYVPEENSFDKIYMRKDNGNSPAALDVIGHEVSHAYIKYHSNVGMNPSDFDACAIREGFADIFGILIERHTKGSTDWSFGEDIGNYTRYFAQPHQDFPDASAENYLQDINWYSQNTVPKEKGWYINSGILRKWFYLLSTRNGYPGNVGIDQADLIAYYTLNWWIWSNLNWPELASQSKAEAEFDFGHCSKEWKTVVKSWQDVGLLANINTCVICCDWIPLEGPDAVIKNVGEEVRLSPHINLDDVSQGGTFSYEIPDSWIAHQEGSDLVVTEFKSNASRMVYVTYEEPNGRMHYGEKVIHLIDENQFITQAKVNLINEGLSHHSVTISPNPANRSLQILLKKPITNAIVTLTDIQGREILVENHTGVKFSISLPNITSGIYLLKIHADNLKTINRIQIIQD